MRIKLLLLVLLLSICGVLIYHDSSQAPQSINHKLHKTYNQNFIAFFGEKGNRVEPAVLLGGDDTRRRFTVVDRTTSSNASLTARPAVISNQQNVTVSWKGVSNAATSYDWIGIYCPPGAESRGYLDYWYVSASPTYKLGYGSVRFTLYNMRVSCEFRYFTTDSQRAHSLRAVSNMVRFVNGEHTPLHGHLALTGKASEMRVQWTSGTGDTPTVLYGTSSNYLSMTATGISRTYKNTDMCGPPANSSLFFINPGFMHDVLLKDLQPNSRYFYRFGSGHYFSELKHFTTGLKAGDSTAFTFIVYGDMDFTPASDLVASQVYQEIELGASFVAHIGDLAYAVGMSYRWDQWMTVIESYSSVAPYMINIGNHEQVHVGGGSKDPSKGGEGFHPSWGNYGHDSGGECGVPTYHRFHMPDNGNGPWWYSYEYGLVHFTQISSENDFTKGSQQYKWIENDLKSVDRGKTPWLILTSHRPLYESMNYPKDNEVSLHLRTELEELFHEYGVDLALYGHYHSYQRTCEMYRGKCSEKGMVHITVGTAGYFLDEEDYLDVPWNAHNEISYGYGKISVSNRTALQWQFFRSRDRTLADSVWLTK